MYPVTYAEMRVGDCLRPGDAWSPRTLQPGVWLLLARDPEQGQLWLNLESGVTTWDGRTLSEQEEESPEGYEVVGP